MARDGRNHAERGALELLVVLVVFVCGLLASPALLGSRRESPARRRAPRPISRARRDLPADPTPEPAGVAAAPSAVAPPAPAPARRVPGVTWQEIATPPPAKPARRVPRLRVFAFCAVAAVLIAGALAGALQTHNAGYRLVIVNGGSMGDAVPNGSVVLAVWRPAAAVDVGDIVLIRQDGGSPRLHRVVARTQNGGAVLITTKGDANDTADAGPQVLPERVLVASTHVPYVGYAMSSFLTPWGWGLMVAIPLTLAMLATLRDIWRAPSTRRAAAA